MSSDCRNCYGEGNFLGGTKSPKKVHFECGNVGVESGLLQAINLAPVGSICTTAYKQEKSPSITFIPLTTSIYIYPDFLVESLNKKKYTLNLRFQMCIFANVDLRRDKLEKITRIIKLFCAWLSIVSVLTDEVKILSFFDPDFLYVRKGRSDG